MAQTPILQHERVDDVPLIIGLANRLRLAEVLNCHLGTHGADKSSKAPFLPPVPPPLSPSPPLGDRVPCAREALLGARRRVTLLLCHQLEADSPWAFGFCTFHTAPLSHTIPLEG
jgi:hypothetical protein